MNRSKRSAFPLIVLGATLAGGALLLAEPQIAIRRPTIPQAQIPGISVPIAGDPGTRGRTARPQPAAQGAPIRLPVMSEELVRAYMEAAERRLGYLPGRVLVKFRNGTGIVGQARALRTLGSDTPMAGMQWVGDVAVVNDRSGVDPKVLAAQLEQQPEVEYAQPDYLLKLHATPNDPSFNLRQWNLAQLKLPAAWDIAPGGSSGMIVAVVDTGITTVTPQLVTVQTWSGSAIVSHQMPVGHSPDFNPARFVLPRDFTLSQSNPSSLVIDTEGHGTHVAGTVGQDTNNGVMLAGIAYNARIMPLKVCQSYWDVQFARSANGIPGFALGSGTCSTAAVTAAIRFAADNGARVLNMSLGGTEPLPAVRDVMAYAISKGVFIAMSNGNDFEEGNPITYPASYAPGLAGAMSVAATTRIETKASYSTTGSFTEIAAPGGDLLQGNVIWQTSILFSDSDEAVVIFPRFDRYNERGFPGTSMASPHVAGLAALLLSRMPSLTPDRIEQIIRITARDAGTAGRDDSFGFGIIQPRVALYGRTIF